MPDSATTAPSTTATGAPPTSPTPGAEGSKPPTGAQNTGFRYTEGPGVPSFLVGKTPEEAASLSNQLYEALVRRQPPPQLTQRPQQPQYQTGYTSPQTGYVSPQNVAPAEPSEDDWAMDPRGAMSKYANYLEQTRLQPFQQQTANLLAQQSKAFLRDRHRKEFERYGPEIELLIDQLPPENQTMDALETVIGIVKSRHLDELAEERAQERLKAMMEKGDVMRSGTQTLAPHAPSAIDLDSAKLPENYRRVLDKNRIDAGKIDEFLLGPAGSLYGATLDERRKNWAELAAKGDIITEEKFSIG